MAERGTLHALTTNRDARRISDVLVLTTEIGPTKPMTRGRIKGDHEGRRIQIAEAACKVFVLRGLARTSLADIAHEMGCTTGVLRHYFADKDELLFCAKNLLFDRQCDRARRASDGYVGFEKLRAMATELLPFGPKSLDQYRLLAMFNGNAIGNAHLVEIQRKRDERHSLLLADVIKALQRDGIVSKQCDARLEASGILALIDGLAEQAIMRQKPFSRVALTGLLDRHLNSLSRPRRAHA
jgi:AcrR family transcriptional regulator